MNIARQQFPTVSVILSVYNNEAYLHDTITSVLNQTFSDFEFIIVNDGSSDGSARILASYQDPRIIHLTHSMNQGLIASLNDALSVASGKFIARLDGDDISLPTRLEEQITAFKEDPQLVLLGSYYYIIDEGGSVKRTVRRPLNNTEIRWAILFENPFGQSSVMLRVDALKLHGLRYDKSMLYAEDYDLWSRLLLYGKGKNIDRPLVKIRHHPLQTSRVFSTEQSATADRIAMSNVERLGVEISIQEMKALRGWLRKPRFVTDQDRQVGLKLLELLTIFGKQNSINPQQFTVIRYRLVNRILEAIGIKNLFLRRNFQLLRAIFFWHRYLVIKYAIKRFMKMKNRG